MSDCPICHLNDPLVVGTQDHGDKVTYQCKRCGEFSISGTAEAVMKRNSMKSRQLSAWIRERHILGVQIPLLTTTFIEEVLAVLPEYGPMEKQMKLLNAISQLTAYPGSEVILIPEYDDSLAWAENSQEFKFYLKSLMDRGFLEINSERRSISDPLYPMVLTTRGWEHLEANQKFNETKIQAFVAMSFDKGLYSVYENAIEPAISSTGYRPYRVDGIPHLDRIDTKIIAEIKNSKFVVADVTQQKSGVYFEAGFAYGLGLPVLWCVRADDLSNVHFDTRQYNHIVWDSEADLRYKLENFILATIGKKLNH